MICLEVFYDVSFLDPGGRIRQEHVLVRFDSPVNWEADDNMDSTECENNVFQIEHGLFLLFYNQGLKTYTFFTT